MKAAIVRSHCRPDGIHVTDVEEPVLCSPNEVKVSVSVSAVNPIDTYIRGGSVGSELTEPWIPGCDFAGQIVEVGADVEELSVGDRVWGSNQSLAGRQGTLAETIVTDQQWVYQTPADVSDEAAAAGALTGITAHLGLHLHGGITNGDIVFVNGGTGGVGSAVVQLARHMGATVVTTARDDNRVATAKNMGAHHALNYHHDDFRSNLQKTVEQLGGVDLWYETLRTPDPEATIPLMAPRGRIIVMAGRDARPVLPVGPLYVNDLRLIGFAMFNASAAEQRHCADAINAAAAVGAFKPIIGRTFELNAAAEAHRLQEENTIHGAGTLSGKIIVRVRD